jgi:hypothetical protein
MRWPPENRNAPGANRGVVDRLAIKTGTPFSTPSAASHQGALLDDDLSIRDIADETGLSKSSVQRLKKKIQAEAVAIAEGVVAAKDTPWDTSL